MLCPKCLSENTDTSKFCNNCATPLGSEEQPSFSATKTLETPLQAISKGTLIAGKYRIIEEIGRGGMGIVYKAEDTKLKRTVALKFLPHQWTSDAQARERFIHEAQAASALDHPQICTIYEIEETDDGRMYISMAFYEGESLREKIKREPLKAEEAVDIAIQVGQGMAKAHQKGIVHRDIKPANILMTKDGAAKIVDFGLAKLAGQVKLTREGTTIGTVAYMSPEQARGDAVDQRTDIWSLGVVLYEMLAEKLPFKGDFEQTLIHSILKSEPEPITKFRNDLPAGLENIIAKALTKNPAARYQTMDELVEDLKAVAEGLKPLRAKAGLLRGRVLGIKKAHAIAGLGVFIILAALALLFLFPKRGQVYDSIAVLPFMNLSSNPGANDASDILTNELILKFYTVGALQVRSWRQVKDYRNTNKSYWEIGKELKVKAVVDPTISSDENRDRVTVSVFDAETEKCIFNLPYDGESGDIQTLLAEIARDVVRKVRVSSTSDELMRLASSQKIKREAYDAYLQAKRIMMTLLAEPSRGRWESAYALLEKSISIDAGFAPAYWSLIDYYYWGEFFSYLSFESYSQSKEALRKGLALDPDSAEAHIASAKLKVANWDWEDARKEYQRAIELSPGNPEAHFSFSRLLVILGRFDEALAEYKTAIQIDSSIDPDKLNLGNIYGNARRYDDAIEIFLGILKSNPKNVEAHSFLAVVYALKKSYVEALSEAEKALALIATSEKLHFHLYAAMVQAYAGRSKEARKNIDEYLTSRKGKPTDAFLISEVYSVLGEKEEAFKWLERAIRDHSSFMRWLKIDPPLDNLRSDPRFKDYLKKAGFEK